MFRRGTDKIIQFHFVQGIDNPPDISPMDRTDAHCAWFGARIKRTGFKFFGRIMLGGEPHQIRLGMTSAIFSSDYSILCFKQHMIIFIHQQRAKGMITMLARLSCDFDRRSKMLKVG